MQTSNDLKYSQSKICHLTSVHPFGDTRIYVKECSTLVNAGYETHLIAPDAPNQVRDGIHLHSVECGKSSRLQRMTKTVWNVYKKAVKINADIYHFHDPELIPIGLILKAQGKKVIYDVHEDVPRQILSKSYIPIQLRYLISTAMEKLEIFASKRFDGIVTATPFIGDRFSKIGCKVVNINNFPIIEEFTTLEKNWTQKKREVCYIGGISIERGIFEMIEAIEQTDVDLLLAGTFTQIAERSEAIEMSGWGKVKELGFLNRQEIAQILAQSMGGLVVLHPLINYLDALPIKMFEYMCAGIPVIASDFDLWKKIIEGNQCGICVDPMNPDAIAAAITWLVDRPEQAKMMGQNGRKAVEKEYNWANEAKKLCDFYHEIIYQ